MERWIDHTPVTVLMTADTVGGVWTYSVELCKALQPFGVYFHLVTMGAPMLPSQKKEIGQLENVTVHETDFLLEWMDDPWKNIDVSGAWLLNLAERLKPGLVHLNGYAYGSLNWNAPVIVVAHSDVFSWWLAVKKTFPPAGWNEYFTRVQSGLMGADSIIAPSWAVMNEIKNIYSIYKPGRVIYNSRSTERFFSSAKIPVACSIGRLWDEAKNTRLLVEAAQHIPYSIRLAGDTSFTNESCTATASNVSLLGKISSAKVAAELSVAAVYVHAAKYEPFGLSILEAALCGCALVLGDITSLREIWGDSALYVDTEDATALAKTVNHLLTNNEDRLFYAKKAIKTAGQYTTIKMATGYAAVYHQLVQSKSQELNINQ